MSPDEKFLAAALVIFVLLVVYRVAPVETVLIALTLLAIVHIVVGEHRR